MTDLSRVSLTEAIWRKASLSVHNGGCVEIAANIPGVSQVVNELQVKANAKANRAGKAKKGSD